MKKVPLATLFVGLSFSAMAQSLNSFDISEGWMLQDGITVRAEESQAGRLRQNSAKQTTEGRQISKSGYDTSSWHHATVPGTILTSLVNDGTYPEPLYGEDNRPEIIPDDLCRKDWWYRVSTIIPEDYAGKNIWLNFDGINYESEVWVNGVKVGPIKGAFTRAQFDISHIVKPGEEASIAVQIIPQPHVGVPSEHTMASVGGPCGGVGRLDGPTFGCSNGWDWLSGIRDRNHGIWRRVWMSATGNAIIKDTYIVSDLPLPDISVADLTVSATVRNITDHHVTGTLRATIDSVSVEKTIQLSPWATQTIVFDPAEYPQLSIKNPRLWWPNGLGEPEMYAASFVFEIDGEKSDSVDTDFGIREVEYFAAGNDNLSLAVNGIKIFCKGGNWGMEEALKRIDYDRMDAQIRMHRDANLNMIRNWGGQSTSEELYSLCDKYGIMVWDEFFQFNSADPIDYDLYMANVKDKVLTFRNHPSIVIWCGRNEAYPTKYLDDGVRYLLTEIDPLRHYQSNSGGGHGCNSGGPYDWTTPEKYYKFSRQRGFNQSETFKTEIGAMSIPTLESIQGMMPESDWYSVTDAWAEHNYISSGGRKTIRLMTERYGAPQNTADFVRKGQMMNYEAHRAMYEGRLGTMYKPTEGILLWMSIPAQPSFVWQMMHYDLEPNAALFAIQKACEPRHIQLNDIEGGTIQVINHTTAPIEGATARVVVYDIDGRILADNSFTVNADACAATDVARLPDADSLPKVHFAKLTLTDSDGNLLSDNFYWRGGNDFTEMYTMPTVSISASAKCRYDGDRGFLDVTLKNSSDRPAIMTHLQLHRAMSGERVLPTFYSDNYVSLAPKESKTVTIEFAKADLNGEQPIVLIDGWNVAVKKSKFVAQNTNADIERWGNDGFGFRAPELTAVAEARINCCGYNRGNFSKDPGFMDGAVGYCVEDIDLSDVPDAGPADIYRTVRWGQCEYPVKVDGAAKSYTVRLHFAEQDNNTPAGKRVFNVKINNQVAAEGIDVAALAGGIYKAYVHTIRGIEPDANGIIKIQLVNGASGSPQICGFEVIPEL